MTADAASVDDTEMVVVPVDDTEMVVVVADKWEAAAIADFAVVDQQYTAACAVVVSAEQMASEKQQN